VEAVTSGIPEQPFGESQTLEGARNRLKAILPFAQSKHDVLIALENGIKEVSKGVYQDFVAAVVFQHDKTREFVGAYVDIPPELNVYVEMSLENPTETFGSRVEKARAYLPGTWMERTTHNSRERQLCQALQRFYVNTV
jgi:non-canonical (house-cleaning) NTP pyrophosphatase